MKTAIRNLIYKLNKFVHSQLKFRHIQHLIDANLLVVGRGTYGYQNLQIDTYFGSEQKVIIGNYTSSSVGVRIITGGIHPYKWVSLYPFRINYQLPGAHHDGTPASNGDIIIGSDVWIGTDAIILSGVTVGDGAVIFASSLVNRDIPPYAMVGGNPARIVGYRFDKEDVEQLMQIKWWNWEESRIRENINLLNGGDIKEFIEKHRISAEPSTTITSASGSSITCYKCFKPISEDVNHVGFVKVYTADTTEKPICDSCLFNY